MGAPRQDSAFIRRAGLGDAGGSGPAAGEEGGCVAGAPPPPPGCLLSGWGVLSSGPVGSLEVPLAPPLGTALSAALAVSTGRGMDTDPLPLACLPTHVATHHPELDAAPNEVFSKGLFGVFQRSMLLVGLPGSASGSCIPFGVRRVGLVDVVPGTPRPLLTRVHHVVCDVALELHGPRDFANFSNPQPHIGFQVRQASSTMSAGAVRGPCSTPALTGEGGLDLP